MSVFAYGAVGEAIDFQESDRLSIWLSKINGANSDQRHGVELSYAISKRQYFIHAIFTPSYAESHMSIPKDVCLLAKPWSLDQLRGAVKQALEEKLPPLTTKTSHWF
ncbi:hypothetical protein ACFQDN_22760 [Pseudomonas asuensis]